MRPRKSSLAAISERLADPPERVARIPDRVAAMSPARLNALAALGVGLLFAVAFGAAVLASPFSPEPSTSPPAGGAELVQAVAATAAAMVVTAVLLLLAVGHRTRRFWLLAWGSRLAERVSGLPGWAALPSGLAGASALVAVIGMYWDISLHIDVGRDPGPLANPAHYFILVGLFGLFTSGFLAIVLPFGRPSASAVRIAGEWYAPLGGILICASGAFSLAGFPLDDLWHRIFGQDVTLWGPTHLMLLGGAAMSLVGVAVLLIEGMRAGSAARSANGGGQRPAALPWVMRLRLIALSGALLIGLSIFQAEFDFGVPQFRFVFQPMLIAAAAGMGLVAVRIWLGRGAALASVAFFLFIRGALALLVGPVLGEATPYFPLYLAEGLLVELVALRVPPRRPLAFGAWCGALIGTAGVAAEWGWSHLWMPIPWPSALLPEAALLALGMALAGAMIGAWMGARLASDDLPRTRALRTAGAVGAVAMMAMIGFALQKTAEPGITARVSLTEVRGEPDRAVMANVRIEPAAAARDADWLTVTSWQGGGFLVDRLERVGPGTYRTTEAIPVSGSWKSVIRLHKDDSLTATPIYLPEDEAIPAAEVPAAPAFTRELVADHEILQREQKTASGALWAIADGIVLAIALGLLALLAWGLHRLALCAPSREPRRPDAPPARTTSTPVRDPDATAR